MAGYESMKAAVEYPARRLARKVTGRHYERTPETAGEEYEPVRQGFLEKFRAAQDWSVEQFMANDAREADARSRREHLAILSDAVRRHDAKSVLEIGCGTGKNVIYLCHTLGVTGAGMELTHAGAETGNLAAERYGLLAAFVQGDMTAEWDVEPADIVFSVFALEQVPNAGPVVEKMERHAHKAVVMIEPFPDFWRGMRGFASRQRGYHLDRLRAGALTGRNYKVLGSPYYDSAFDMPTAVEIVK
jgi:trans-aconitate methyltransferase